MHMSQPQTASQLVQPLLHSSAASPTHRQTDTETTLRTTSVVIGRISALHASVVAPSISYNKHCCVLSNSGLSNATSKLPKLVKKCSNYGRDTAKIGIRTSKIGYLLPVCHRNNSWLADDILWYQVKNYMCNCLQTNATETKYLL